MLLNNESKGVDIMTVTIDDRNKILRYWLIIEALTPQKADRENPKDRREPIYTVQAGLYQVTSSHP